MGTMCKFRLNIVRKEAKCNIKANRLDNSGENNAFKKLIDQHKTSIINFEFTAHVPPEQNGRIKRNVCYVVWQKQHLC